SSPFPVSRHRNTSWKPQPLSTATSATTLVPSLLKVPLHVIVGRSERELDMLHSSRSNERFQVPALLAAKPELAPPAASSSAVRVTRNVPAGGRVPTNPAVSSGSSDGCAAGSHAAAFGDGAVAAFNCRIASTAGPATGSAASRSKTGLVDAWNSAPA